MTLGESVTKILSHNGELTPLFYERFFAQVPAAQPFFAKTNMKHQAAILRMSLQMIEQFSTHGFEAIGDYLQVIGFKHRERGIPQDMYAEWRDTLLDTLEEFHGDEWGSDLETEWTQALNRSIDKMVEGYELSSAAI
ncbi:MAG: globin domain-containing protein [Planctomycetota bacterium]|jgi:hemoglobin-like flavoprotein